MRKVIMMVTLSCDRTHFIPGQEVEFENEEAQRLVDAHFAKFADNEIIEDEISSDEIVEGEEPLDEIIEDEIVETKKKTSKK